MSYNPSVGRWMQQDPAGYIDGPNLFQFELDNPVVGLDPTGLADAPTTQPANPTPPDFGQYKGQVPNPKPATGHGDADAGTELGIGPDPYTFTEPQNADGSLSIKANPTVTFFDPNKSWVDPNQKNNQQLLHHEQGHWKIAWWFAQQAQNGCPQKVWATAPARSGEAGQRQAEAAANQAIQKYFADFQNQMNQLQQAYDQYTQSGTNAANQQELDKLTPEQLVNRLKQINKPQ